MVYRFASKKFVIVTSKKMEDNLKKGHNFKFNIILSDLALNPDLLNAFNFISIHADSFKNKRRIGNPLITAAFGYSEPPASKQKAIDFFKIYLGAFLNNEPELNDNDLLSIMVTDSSIQDKIIQIFES